MSRSRSRPKKHVATRFKTAIVQAFCPFCKRAILSGSSKVGVNARYVTDTDDDGTKFHAECLKHTRAQKLDEPDRPG